MDFGAMTSLSGGGGLDMSSSASADGDNAFGGNSFDYRTNNGGNSNTIVVVGLFAVVALFIVAKAVN
jgi:hypothetical protein